MKLNYILPLLKSVLLMSVILMLVYNNANVIKAETNGQETVTDTSGWSDYDYKDIDKILKESSYNSVTFEDIVDSIYSGNLTRYRVRACSGQIIVVAEKPSSFKMRG